MVQLYVRLILNNARTFASVPANLKNEVKEALYEMGYDENGDPLDPETEE